ncbi:MAG TPA: ABC transporter ATP-binding protein [Candidatus Methylomirabilis sp.]|nr:ABC transporter ATP-binding protein [Candidatus Methylomirabilis sp.]
MSESPLAHSLVLRHISKHYGELAAVAGVSLSVPRGQFLTLLGPSGSGKTTLLMVIAGFVEPTAGDVLLDDRPITSVPPERRNFGMVFQGYALFPHLTVLDNVAFPLRVRGIAKTEIAERVRAALDLVRLAPLAERLPRQLSGGQQQRVALARALVFAPHVLLLDEPLSALDKKLRAELQWELKALHRRVGTTFIYVTHDQDEALSMSDQIAIIREGRLIQIGPPRSLYERPRTRFVADFLGKSNFVRGRVEALQAGCFTYTAGGATYTQKADGATVTPGEPVLVALRPEKIALSLKQGGDDNNVRGEVTAWNYSGTNFHLLARTASLGELAVTTPAWRSDLEPELGQSVWLSWPADATVVVAED